MASETALKKRLEPPTNEERRRIHEMLMSWLEGDEEDRREQRETFDYLKQVLDEDRFSTRKLFR